MSISHRLHGGLFLPSKMLKSQAWWWVSAEMVLVASASQITRSASDPTPICPCISSKALLTLNHARVRQLQQNFQHVKQYWSDSQVACVKQNYYTDCAQAYLEHTIKALPIKILCGKRYVHAAAYLPWVDIKDLSSIGRGDSHEPTGVHFTVVNSLLPDYRHPVLDTVNPIRDFPEVVLPQGLLVSVKCTVVCSCRLQISTGSNQRAEWISSWRKVCVYF